MFKEPDDFPLTKSVVGPVGGQLVKERVIMKINLGSEPVRALCTGSYDFLMTLRSRPPHYRETFDRAELFLLISRRVGRADGISSRLLSSPP